MEKNSRSIKHKPFEAKDIPLFRDLSIEEKKFVEKSLKTEVFKKGEILFAEGMSCERIFIVKSGRVKISRVSSSGQEQVLEVLEPGDTCACNPGQPHWACSSSSQALTDCSVWILSRLNYVQMVKTNSQLARTLNHIFADRLCKFCSLIETVSMDDPQKRLIKFFLEMADSQEHQCSDKGCIFLNMTQEDISQRLGVTRVTVARHLQKLKELKLISHHDRSITILDEEGLKNALL